MKEPWLKTILLEPRDNYLTLTNPEINGTVDVIFTSPPYFEKDGWDDYVLDGLRANLFHSLKDSGRAFVNFGQIKESFERPFQVQQYLTRMLTPCQTIAWIKSIAIDERQRGHYQPLQGHNYLNYCWEPIFQFAKGKPETIERLAIGVPYADESNLKRGTRGKNGNLHCAGDAWFIPYPTTGKKVKKKHRHQFPPELARRALLMCGVTEGWTVMDPFSGSGTTACEAKKLGANAIAVDIDAEAIENTRENWEATAVARP